MDQQHLSGLPSSNQSRSSTSDQQQPQSQPQQREHYGTPQYQARDRQPVTKLVSFYLVNEDTSITVRVPFDPPISLREVTRLVAAEYRKTVTSRQPNPHSLFLLLADGTVPKFTLPITAKPLQRAIRDPSEKSTHSFEQLPFVLVFDASDAPVAQPDIKYPTTTHLPTATELVEQPQLQKRTFSALGDVNTELMQLMLRAVQVVIVQQSVCLAAFRSIQHMHAHHATITDALKKDVQQLLDKYTQIADIADPLKTLLMRVRVQPEYVGLPRTPENVPLLFLHESFPTQDRFESMMTKAKTAEKKLRKLLKAYDDEASKHKRPFVNKGRVDALRMERREASSTFTRIHAEQATALRELTSMKALPVEDELKLLLDRHKTMNELTTRVVELTHRMPELIRLVVGEVVKLESDYKQFSEQYNRQNYKYAFNFLARTARRGHCLLHLPHTTFKLMTEVFRRRYTKRRYLHAMKEIEGAVCMMRDRELSKRNAFADDREFLEFVPANWPIKDLLSGCPRSCLKPIRDYDENLPDVNPDDVTAWLNETEVVATEVGLKDAILTDDWFAMRAETIEKFDAQCPSALDQLRNREGEDPFDTINRASRKMHPDQDAEKLQERLRELEDDVIALHLENYVKDFLLEHPPASVALQRNRDEDALPPPPPPLRSPASSSSTVVVPSSPSSSMFGDAPSGDAPSTPPEHMGTSPTTPSSSLPSSLSSSTLEPRARQHDGEGEQQADQGQQYERGHNAPPPPLSSSSSSSAASASSSWPPRFDIETLVRALQRDKNERAPYRHIFGVQPMYTRLLRGHPAGPSSIVPSDDEGSPTPRPRSLASSSAPSLAAAAAVGTGAASNTAAGGGVNTTITGTPTMTTNSVFYGMSPSENVSPVHAGTFATPSLAHLPARLHALGAVPVIQENPREGLGEGGVMQQHTFPYAPAQQQQQQQQQQQYGGSGGEEELGDSQFEKFEDESVHGDDNSGDAGDTEQGRGSEGEGEKGRSGDRGSNVDAGTMTDRQTGEQQGEVTALREAKEELERQIHELQQQVSTLSGENEALETKMKGMIDPSNMLDTSVLETTRSQLSSSSSVLSPWGGDEPEPKISFFDLKPGDIALFLRSPKKTCMMAFTKRAREYILTREDLVDMGVLKSPSSPTPGTLCVRLISVERRKIESDSALEFKDLNVYVCKGSKLELSGK
ncbi:hypothetical protein PTSG_13089 [Salpingoeca rosetta]|uniref:Uncharacterized protein n=1 Tax=Salpingoeca rosetta (strain ATCC 50818 / BSB-021) TaxID=946362 RepID=F2UQ49_SALR5|nr:uncharacterized protein PTSG_13089 [Salpingoeca rosetta]XP_012493100.1 hypothetical protein, variant [Salpingoeca rosetta]EGD79717.1 hypothetical protein, variant [Salpingoeca rosetta]EGD79718.1 hypothetical protein PTSG_13089 [Salpingoeca rosetta]|eukprot:XP_004988667.1 hypothetical protein PTSG_13089 [Salpingoeca rosetta]